MLNIYIISFWKMKMATIERWLTFTTVYDACSWDTSLLGHFQKQWYFQGADKSVVIWSSFLSLLSLTIESIQLRQKYFYKQVWIYFKCCFLKFQDPFEMNVKKRAKGTKDEPTLIPSMYEKRLVGCICKLDFKSLYITT